MVINEKIDFSQGLTLRKRIEYKTVGEVYLMKPNHFAQLYSIFMPTVKQDIIEVKR